MSALRPASRERTIGVALSYLSSALTIVSTVLLTPYLVRSLGINVYGQWQLAVTYAGYLTILNFGLRVVTSRQVSMARSRGLAPPQLAPLLGVLALGLFGSFGLLAVGGLTSSALIDSLFGGSLDTAELETLRNLYWLCLLNLAVVFCGDFLLGVLTGFERFRAVYAVSLLRLFARAILIVGLVSMGQGALGVVWADLAVSIVIVLFLLRYCLVGMRVRISWRGMDFAFARESFKFGLALLLGSISIQVNMTVDKVILGSLIDAEAVAVYSIALTLYTAFATVTLTVGNVYIPRAVQMVHDHADSASLTQMIVRPGRVQMIVGLATLGAFVLLGREFIGLWVGPSFSDAWGPALVLLVPNLIVSVECVAVAVLDARMKRAVRSVVALLGAALNIALTLWLVPRLGLIGAAWATCVSVVITEIGIMNWYYHRHLGIDVPVLFRDLSSGIVPTFAVCIILLVPLGLFDSTGVPAFLFKSGAYCVVCAFAIYRFGINGRERRFVRAALSRCQRLGIPH